MTTRWTPWSSASFARRRSNVTSIAVASFKLASLARVLSEHLAQLRTGCAAKPIARSSSCRRSASRMKSAVTVSWRPAVQEERPDARRGAVRPRTGGSARRAARCTVSTTSHASAKRLQRLRGQAHRVHTARHRCDQVLLATGTTRLGNYSSFVLAAPHRADRQFHHRDRAARSQRLAGAAAATPHSYTTTDTLHNYFRITSDHRLVFGGARFVCRARARTPRAARCCARNCLRAFPQLRRRAHRLPLGRT